MKNARPAANTTVAYLALLFCLHLLVATAPAGAQSQPAISIEPLELDFGKMEQFEAKSAIITIRNTGNAPLNLGEVEATCGCTAATPPVASLAPGQSTEVTITFNSEKFRGPQLKTVKVNSDDPFQAVIEITIRAEVHAALIVTPARELITFRKFPAGTSPTETIRFFTEDFADLTIAPGRYNTEIFDVSIMAAGSGDPREQIAVLTVRPTAPLGTIREIVSFETSVPKRSSVNIEVAGVVIAPVTLDPDQVNLRYLKRDEVVSRTFEVKIRRGHKIEVTGAEIDLPGFKVKDIAPSSDSRSVIVTIEGSPVSISDERAVSARGRMKGVLRIFTDNPDFPELNASVVYLLKL